MKQLTRWIFISYRTAGLYLIEMQKSLATIRRFFLALLPRAAPVNQLLLSSASSRSESFSSPGGNKNPLDNPDSNLIVHSKQRSPPRINNNLPTGGRQPPSDDPTAMKPLATMTTKSKGIVLYFSRQKNPFYFLALRNSYSTSKKKLVRNSSKNFYGLLQNFESLQKEGFFMDKTTNLDTFENTAQSLMVLSPQGTGKSMLVDMIDNFYNLEYYEFVPIPQSKAESSKKKDVGVQKEGSTPEASTRTRECYKVRWKSHGSNPFASLNISKHSSWNKIKEKQGRFPVIKMDFQKLSSDSKAQCIESFVLHLEQTFEKFSYLKKYQEYTKLMNFFQQLRNQVSKGQPILGIQHVPIQQSLKLMTELLYHHHGKKVMILIDEYDRPFRNFLYQEIQLKLAIHNLEIQQEMWKRKGKQKEKQQCQDQIIQKRNAMKRCQEGRKEAFDIIIRTIGAAYKGNNSLKKGLLVGIFKVLMIKSQTGFNNVTVYSTERGQFNTDFGLTEDYVKGMIEKLFKNNDMQLLKNIKKFYNGYQNKVNLQGQGSTLQKRFNTLSVMKYLGLCFDENQVEDFRSFWLQKSSSNIIKMFFGQPNNFFLKSRILDRQLQTPVKIATSLDLGTAIEMDSFRRGMQENIINTLLYSTGLLTGRIKDGILYARIPNEQIWRKFNQEFQNWAKTALGGNKSEINFFNLEETIAKIHSSLLCYQEYAVDKQLRESVVQGIVFARWFISEQQIQNIYQKKKVSEKDIYRFNHLILPIQHGTFTQSDSSGQTEPRADNTAIIHVYKKSLGQISAEWQYVWGLQQILERGYIEALFKEKGGKKQIKDPSIKYVILRSIVFVHGEGKKYFIYHNAKDETFTIEQAEQLLELKRKEVGKNIQEIQKTILERTKKNVNMEGSSFKREE